MLLLLFKMPQIMCCLWLFEMALCLMLGYYILKRKSESKFTGDFFFVKS